MVSFFLFLSSAAFRGLKRVIIIVIDARERDLANGKAARRPALYGSQSGGLAAALSLPAYYYLILYDVLYIISCDFFLFLLNYKGKKPNEHHRPLARPQPW